MNGFSYCHAVQKYSQALKHTQSFAKMLFLIHIESIFFIKIPFALSSSTPSSPPAII